MAQIGSLGLLASLRIKKGILGSLIWSYFVCPEIYHSSATMSHAAAAVEDTVDKGLDMAVS
jgi:hypothetical protein